MLIMLLMKLKVCFLGLFYVDEIKGKVESKPTNRNFKSAWQNTKQLNKKKKKSTTYKECN